MNAHKERARTMKALQLTAVLRSAGAIVADFDRGVIDWELAARAAGVNPPSEETKAMVRSMLSVAEGEVPGDPFAGLAC